MTPQTPGAGAPHLARGRICLWQDGSLWIGRSQGQVAWHSHHAIQIAVALDGHCRLRSRSEADWSSYAAAIVPSHQEHQFETAGVVVANIFVEPESAAGRALGARYAGGIAGLPAAVQQAMVAQFQAAIATGATRAQLEQAAHLAVQQLAGTGTPAQAVDARILKAIGHIRQHLDTGLPLPAVAAAVALSPSRFRHLFVHETGTSFRAYVLWTRLNAALEAVMAGCSWTEGAHAAGFADSSHLNRSFKRMFGLNPSSIVSEDWQQAQAQP